MCIVHQPQTIKSDILFKKWWSWRLASLSFWEAQYLLFIRRLILYYIYYKYIYIYIYTLYGTQWHPWFSLTFSLTAAFTPPRCVRGHWKPRQKAQCLLPLLGFFTYQGGTRWRHLSPEMVNSHMLRTGKSQFLMGKLWKITIFHGKTMENHHVLMEKHT